LNAACHTSLQAGIVRHVISQIRISQIWISEL
jgi:hypothetical protein